MGGTNLAVRDSYGRQSPRSVHAALHNWRGGPKSIFRPQWLTPLLLLEIRSFPSLQRIPNPNSK